MNIKPRKTLMVALMMTTTCSLIADVETQLRRDAARTDAWKGKSLVCYAVPAVSNEKRLPNRIPRDGRPSDEIRVVGARGEFIPASFMIFPLEDIGEAELKVSDLKNGDAQIPASDIDVRVVKCWYQGGTAWHSYFADDDRRTLVPELLLHDETLIKVDREKKENYLRVGDAANGRYLWVSYPGEAKGALNVFNHATEPVADSPELQPFKLTANQGKQFWITIKIPADAAPGLYSGTIDIVADGKRLGSMNLSLRALPFTLPKPKTYYDLTKDFNATIYNHTNFKVDAEFLGENQAAAERKIKAELKNLRDHNVDSPLVGRCGDEKDMNLYARQFELMKEAGMTAKPLFGFLLVYDWATLYRYLREGNDVPPETWKRIERLTDAQLDLVEEKLGHRDVYGIGWDEPGRKTLEAQQKLFELLHDKGAKVFDTAKDSHLDYAGFNEDVANYSGSLFSPESAEKWHTMGAKVFSYAGPHTGPENPDFIRRSHGLQLYKSNFDGTGNYRYYGYRQNVWNDFENGRYRICFVYPIRDGVIDTLHWEGFREGLDDVKYATKLRQDAKRAIAAGGAKKRYAGKKALRYLALLDADKADLNSARLEMINHIMNIREAMKGNEK